MVGKADQAEANIAHFAPATLDLALDMEKHTIAMQWELNNDANPLKFVKQPADDPTANFIARTAEPKPKLKSLADPLYIPSKRAGVVRVEAD